MRYISWNCRGLGSTLKEEAMKDLVRIHNPEILLVQETKMGEAAVLQAGKKFWKKALGLPATLEEPLEVLQPSGIPISMLLKLKLVSFTRSLQNSPIKPRGTL